MRISDWSSVVCSSDLADRGRSPEARSTGGHGLLGGVVTARAGLAADGVHDILRQFSDERRAAVRLGDRDHNLLHPRGDDVRADFRVPADIARRLHPSALLAVETPPFPPCSLSKTRAG